jgi:hypothetical protein
MRPILLPAVPEPVVSIRVRLPGGIRACQPIERVIGVGRVPVDAVIRQQDIAVWREAIRGYGQRVQRTVSDVGEPQPPVITAGFADADKGPALPTTKGRAPKLQIRSKAGPPAHP